LADDVMTLPSGPLARAALASRNHT
jgi:hypothetical protein